MNNVLEHIPDDKRGLLEELVVQLRELDGMAAIALGGSYAGGTQHAASDLDIGLYYREAVPFSIAAIRRIARSASMDQPPTVTDFYEWGAWVNGGAWIQTRHGKVDFLYRNLDQVRRTIEAALRGAVEHDYDQQPTYGFYSVIYLAETNICIPLFDPYELLRGLKRRVAGYPPALKDRLVQDSLWSAEFTLRFARDFAARGDIYNTAGCLTRIAASLTQALFALNETYFIRDKRVMETLGVFRILPGDYVKRLGRVLSRPGDSPQRMGESVSEIEGLWRDIVALTDPRYQPKFQV